MCESASVSASMCVRLCVCECKHTLLVGSGLQDASQRTHEPPRIGKYTPAAGSGPEGQIYTITG